MARDAERVRELDLLRFFAALSVAVYHLTSWPGREGAFAHAAQLGFLGVPLFFMISGFVILMTVENRTPAQFVSSRIARLYPTFWACVLLTTCLLLVLGPEPPSAAQLAANLTMLPAVFGERNIDGVYWSLVVEMKFYGLVLLLLVLRQRRQLEAWLAAWLVGAAVALLDHAPHLLRSLTLHPWGSLFIAGCYLYRIRGEGPAPRLIAPFCVAMCISITCATGYQQNYTHTVAASTQLAVALIIVVLHVAFLTLAMRLWSLPPLRLWFWLGSLTYPLYLLHARSGKAVWMSLPGDAWLRVWIVLALTMLLSLLFAATVERRACRALNAALDRATGLIAVRWQGMLARVSP